MLNYYRTFIVAFCVLLQSSGNVYSALTIANNQSNYEFKSIRQFILTQSDEYEYQFLFSNDSFADSSLHGIELSPILSVENTTITNQETSIATQFDLAYRTSQVLSNISSVQSQQSPISPLLDTIPSNEFLFAGSQRYTVFGDPALNTSVIKPIGLTISGLAYVSMIAGLHIYQQQTLWNRRSGRFHVAEDGNYAHYIDKIGHFYGGYIMSYYSSEILQASGIAYEPAKIWGTLMGIGYMMYIELEDGFATGWSYSPSDMFMNLAGSSYHLIQHYVPFLENINLKWLYTPPSWIGGKVRRNPYDTSQTYTTFNDDYSASTFIVSVNVYNILPKEWKKYWVPWLNIGGGYVMRNLGWRDQSRRIALTLDWNLVELLPDFKELVGGTTGDFLNWLKQSLNYFKLPSPTLEFSEQGITRLRLFYPFQLQIANITF